MKKIVIVILSFLVVHMASAQKGFHGGGYRYRPHVSVAVGGHFPVFGFGYYGMPYYGYGYAPGGNYRRQSKLDMKVDDIKHDYADRINSVKMDTNLTHKQRRIQVRELKQQRDDAIYDVKRNYYRS